jgi:hypothetical protein
LNTSHWLPVSLDIGWLPPTRSMIARRLCPSAMLSPVFTPRPSGPRWLNAAVIGAIEARTSGLREPSSAMIPQMPHMFYESRKR